MTVVLADPIGWRRDGVTPIWLPSGGDRASIVAGPDEGEDPDLDPDDDLDDPDGGDGDDPDGELSMPPQQRRDSRWTPPSRKEIEKMQAALKRNNSELRDRRHLAGVLEEYGLDVDGLRDLLATRDTDTDPGPDGGDDDGPGTEPTPPAAPAPTGGYDQAAVDRAVAAAVAKATRDATKAAKLAGAAETERYRTAHARAAVLEGLRAEKWRGGDPERVLRLVDLDKIELDDDGETAGVEEIVAGIKEEFPEWFRERPSPTRTRRGAADVDGNDRGTPGRQQTGWASQIAQRFDQGR